MKKALLLVTIVCLAALTGFAGDKAGQATAADHAAKLQQELNLTAEQTAKVESLFAGFLPKFEAARASAKAMREEIKALHGDAEGNAQTIEAKQAEVNAVHAELKAQMAARSAQLQEILTPEQFVEYQEIEAAHMKKMQGGEHGQTGQHGEKKGGPPH